MFDFKSTLKSATSVINKVGGVLKKADSLLSKISNTVNVNRVSPFAPNMHIIWADIGGVRCSRQSGCSITYREVCDYVNLDFPMRFITIKAPHSYANKIFSLKGNAVEGFPKAILCNIIVKPVDMSGFLENPIPVTRFIGIVQNSEMAPHLKSVIDGDSHMNQKELGSKLTTVEIALYKPDEIDYQSKAKINYNLPNPKPSDIINMAFNDTFDKYRLCMSKIENDVPLGRMIVPHTSFTSLLRKIDAEVNLYSTNMYTCVEGDIFYILNSDNDPNVENKDLTSNLCVEVIRPGSPKVYPRIIAKLGNNNYLVTTNSNEISTSVDNSSAYKDNKIYITPSGKRFEQNNPMGRNQVVIRKNTEAAPGMKLNNAIYEIFEVTVMGGPIAPFTPLSNIITRDANGQTRIYRMIYKEISIESVNKTITTYRGRRLIDGS